MADFIKVHGMQIANGGHIKNVVVENLASDPSSPAAGRIWFNTASKVWKATFLDTDGSTVIIRTFATKEALDAFIASMASTTVNASGAKLVGYDGQIGANGKFSIAAGMVDSAIDAIVVKVDAVQQVVDDFTGASGAITELQTEVNTIETAVGLSADGSFVAFSGTNYLDATASIANAIGSLDSQLKSTDVVAKAALPKAGGVMTGNIVLNGNLVTGSAAPINAGDLVNKAYVDGYASGLRVKDPVKAATVSGQSLTLSGEQTVDGVALVAGDRILVKNQIDPIENGIYVVAAGAWTRSTDADGSPEAEIIGAYVYVEQGVANDSTGWTMNGGAPTIVGTSPITFVQFSHAGLLQAGNGLSKDGNILSINMGAGITTMPNDQVGIDLRANSGLWLTEDGVVSSTGAAAQLAIKVDGNSLVMSANGIRVSDSFTGNVDAIQTEVNAIEAAVGLDNNGTMSPFSGTNYIDAAGTVITAITTLDTQIKTVSETSIANLKTAINARVYTFQAGTTATSFTINHALNTEMVEVQVWVLDGGKYRQAVVAITVDDANNIVVDLTEAAQIRAIVRSATTIA